MQRHSFSQSIKCNGCNLSNKLLWSWLKFVFRLPPREDMLQWSQLDSLLFCSLQHIVPAVHPLGNIQHRWFEISAWCSHVFSKIRCDTMNRKTFKLSKIKHICLWFWNKVVRWYPCRTSEGWCTWEFHRWCMWRVKAGSYRDVLVLPTLSPPHTGPRWVSRSLAGVLAELFFTKLQNSHWTQPPYPEMGECRRCETLLDEPMKTLFEAYWALKVQWLLWAKLDQNQWKSISHCFDSGER